VFLFLKKYYYYLIIIITLVVLITVMRVDVFLKNPVSPNGIIDFELAETPAHAQEILQDWSSKARLYATFSLGIDYLFLIFYTLFFILTTYKLTQHNQTFFRRTALYISLLFLVAGIFDALENYFLFHILTGSVQASWVQNAYYFSMAKFTLLAIGILYLLLAFSFRFFRSKS